MARLPPRPACHNAAAMADKERDTMLREMAQNRGLKLVKSRRRKPGGDFGRYGLTDGKTGRECLGFGEDGLTATDAEVEAYLRSGERATWKRSLIGAVAAVEAEAPAADKRPEKKRAPKPPPPPKPKPEPEPESEPAHQPELELEIRTARKADAAGIAALLHADEDEVAERLALLIRAKAPVLVAVRGEIVGCVASHVVPSLQRRSFGRVTLLLVAEAARLQGIGKALLEAAERALTKLGCEQAEVTSEIDFASAHGFFRRAGYERTSYRFGRNLPGGG